MPSREGRNVTGAAAFSATGSMGLASGAIATHLWLHWLEVSVDRERVARKARAKSLTLTAGSTPLSQAMRVELQASMVGISAAAHAIDAIYGEIRPLVPIRTEVEQSWTANRTPRRTRILETLKAGCTLGARTNRWPPEFQQLYGLRDQVVHHGLTHRPAVPHPNGVSNVNVSQEMADYCVENLAEAVSLAFDVAATTIEAPRIPELHERAGRMQDVPTQLRGLLMERGIEDG